MKYVSVMAATCKAARQAVPDLTDDQANAVAGAVFGAVEGTLGALMDAQREAVIDDVNGGRLSCAAEHVSLIEGLTIAQRVLQSLLTADEHVSDEDAVQTAELLETTPSWTTDDVKAVRAHVGRDVLLHTSRDNSSAHERGRLLGVAVDGRTLVIGVDVAGGV